LLCGNSILPSIHHYGYSFYYCSFILQCAKIKNQWDGVEHDFTHKSGIVYQNILLPNHAPPEYRDRATLWNAVELAEKVSDSRLCMECIVALPVELSPEQQIELVEAYVREILSARECAQTSQSTTRF